MVSKQCKCLFALCGCPEVTSGVSCRSRTFRYSSQIVLSCVEIFSSAIGVSESDFVYGDTRCADWQSGVCACKQQKPEVKDHGIFRIDNKNHAAENFYANSFHAFLFYGAFIRDRSCGAAAYGKRQISQP